MALHCTTGSKRKHITEEEDDEDEVLDKVEDYRYVRDNHGEDLQDDKSDFDPNDSEAGYSEYLDREGSAGL